MTSQPDPAHGVPLDDAAQLARVKACPVCKGDGITSTMELGPGGGHYVVRAFRCTACGGKPAGPRPAIVQAAVDFLSPPADGVAGTGHQTVSQQTPMPSKDDRP